MGFMVIIKTEVAKEFRSLTGWDDVFATRAEAQACADRATKKDWYAAKVVEVDDEVTAVDA
jgi:hypothetical protein